MRRACDVPPPIPAATLTLGRAGEVTPRVHTTCLWARAKTEPREAGRGMPAQHPGARLGAPQSVREPLDRLPPCLRNEAGPRPPVGAILAFAPRAWSASMLGPAGDTPRRGHAAALHARSWREHGTRPVSTAGSVRVWCSEQHEGTRRSVAEDGRDSLDGGQQPVERRGGRRLLELLAHLLRSRHTGQPGRDAGHGDQGSHSNVHRCLLRARESRPAGRPRSLPSYLCFSAGASQAPRPTRVPGEKRGGPDPPGELALGLAAGPGSL